MADTKISALNALTRANVATDDELVIVDTSAGETKRMVWSELAAIGSRATPSANQTIATSTVTDLSFDTDDYNDASYWSAGADTRMTAGVAGYYAVQARYRSQQTTGDMQLYFRVNGAGAYAQDRRAASSSGATTISISTVLKLAASDYVTATVWQDSGGNADTTASSCEFTMTRVG